MAAILAAPDADGPRLAYADAVGGERAELIRVQCTQRTANTTALQARESELLRALAARIKDEAGVRTTCPILRGFPDCLIGDVADIVASERALETQPIRSVVITRGHAELPRLVPLLGRVRELELSAARGAYGAADVIPAAQLAALADAELPALVRLVLERRSVDAAGARALAPGPWVPRLVEIVAPEVVLAPELVERLRDARVLYLEDTRLRGELFAALVRAPLHALDELVLSGYGLDAQDVPALAARFPGLRRLALAKCVLGDDAARVLATMPALERLDLRGNVITRAGVEALTGAPALRELGITGNSLGTGEYTSGESGSVEAGDYTSWSAEVQESTASLAARFGGRVRIE